MWGISGPSSGEGHEASLVCGFVTLEFSGSENRSGLSYILDLEKQDKCLRGDWTEQIYFILQHMLKFIGTLGDQCKSNFKGK